MFDIPALSIQQPWAYAILYLDKRIEYRNWYTDFRGRFYIHAPRKIDKEGIDDIEYKLPSEFDTGGIVGIATLVDCKKETGLAADICGADYEFILQDVQPVKFVPCVGDLGFFKVDLSKQYKPPKPKPPKSKKATLTENVTSYQRSLF